MGSSVTMHVSQMQQDKRATPGCGFSGRPMVLCSTERWPERHILAVFSRPTGSRAFWLA